MKKKEFISVLITNFNKEKYILKSLTSVMNQSYDNFETIVFDDKSTDNSIQKLKKIKTIKLIRNKKKKLTTGPLNQINGILEAFNVSKGKIICLMDADDEFKKKKLYEINKFFFNNHNIDFVLNFPQQNSNFNLKRTKVNNSIWPSIFPTSCISFRRSFFKQFKKNLLSKKCPNLEIDARLIIYAYHHEQNKINYINISLTNYIKNDDGISSYYPKFSLNWWYKRKEAFDYLIYILKTKNKKFIKSPDYFMTNMISIFLKIFKKIKLYG